MKPYNHIKIEKKWQKYWESKKLNRVKENAKDAKGNKKKKFYSLIEFPYPSGEGLHVGHIRSNTAMDIISRKRRMEGYNVLYPIGWDAFGLPTENYAIKTGIQPAIVTKRNTDTFRKQLKALGFSFDWSCEINTTDPKYYKWTQWIFLQFLKEGLAYKKRMTINWCPKDLIGLANEEVIDGCCERCGTKVEKRDKEQWMLAITKYADRLDRDLDHTEFLEKIKIQQRNWIGKSEGAEIDFQIKINNKDNKKINVFTTRPDTIFGVTYIVLSPEHSLVKELMNSISNKNDVEKYIKDIKNKSDIERTDAKSDKTGIELQGIKAINPANNEEVPVWIADYVLADYGTGAVMAVPAHDERDRQFAEKYNLPIREIELVDKKEITESVGGKWVTKYKLRDWIFSRQRYWGEPIPVVHCEKCGIVPVPEKELPIKLPKVKNYKPTETGESPLANIDKWVNTKCPKCRAKGINSSAKRETDTMPNWAGSSWYYLRYTDTKNKKAFADKKNLEYWTPVDWYNGGMEHTTLHLLYSRFWHKFLYDKGLVPTDEPYKKRTSHGLILAEGGEKMSKSKGNVISPDNIIKNIGADSLRLYEMFMGPFDQDISWDTNNIAGVRRFLEKIWRLQDKVEGKSSFRGRSLSERNLSETDVASSAGRLKGLFPETLVNQTIKKVEEDIEAMKWNTAISSLMILVNEFERQEKISKENYEIILKLISPFAPHLGEELWSILGNKKSITLSSWPEYNKNKIIENEITIVVQINGKVRASFEIGINESEENIRNMALNMIEIKKWIDNKEIKKIIFIKGKLVNIVV